MIDTPKTIRDEFAIAVLQGIYASGILLPESGDNADFIARYCYFQADAMLKARGVSHGADDKVNHPKHYTQHPSVVECIQVTEHMNFNLGNAVKYLWRADHKNGVEDLKKAVWYIQREIARKSNE